MIQSELFYAIGALYLLFVIISIIVESRNKKPDKEKTADERSNDQHQELVKAQSIRDPVGKTTALKKLLSTPNLEQSVRMDAEESLRALTETNWL